MWRRKRFIIIAILTVVMLGAILGGYAVAQADDETANQTPNGFSTMLDKVAAIYQQNTGTAIDAEELSKAFTQAGKEIRDEALDKYLDSLVEKGKIDSDQAKQYKDWLNSKPDVPVGPGFGGGPRGFGRFGGMRGWCAPNGTPAQ